MPEPAPHTSFHFAGHDGTAIFARCWRPATEHAPRAAVLIAHGAAEHGLRYQRLARRLVQGGYLVYAPDHRGHGRTAASKQELGAGGSDAWNDMVRDLERLLGRIRDEHPGLPVFLLGHSMGSLLAQRAAQLFGERLAGVVLSGSFGTLADLDATLAALEPLARGSAAEEPSAGFAAMFASFNQPFAPGETGFEWLSRDPEEVRAYVEDPLCGFPFSNRLAYALLEGARETWRPENERRVPRGLPILVISGDRDPVGADTDAVRPLLERYAAHGVRDLAHRFYPGARHELLNETNRDEVERDLLRWLDERSGAG